VEIPSIDLATLEGAACSEELERLHCAARDIGAFRLLGHGVDPGIAEELLLASRRLFALPQAERDEMDMIHSPYFRGFSALGTERTQGQADLREQFDVGPEEARR
jgi:isopenicillin N synthase-like dioxygenase